MKTKKKIVHIHSDVKFINSVNRFDSEQFENSIIYIGNKQTYEGLYKDSVQYFNSTKKEFRKIIDQCKSADMVVLYNLNFQKSYIANQLPKSVIVVWRFFGSELYSKIPNLVHSDKTKEVLQKFKNQEKVSKLSLFKKRIFEVLVRIKYNANPKKEFLKAAFERSDYFLGLAKDEFEYLKTVWKDLPPFIQINYDSYTQVKKYEPKKSNLVILGNNKSAYNNHFDIIEILEQSKGKKNYNFLMFFNYGKDNSYSNLVKEQSKKVEEIKVQEEFLDRDEFNHIYSNADAFVMNGYRQMAIGNIFEAIRQNTKIYLNEKNLIFDWLKNEGFHILSIEDLKTDIEQNNLKLTESEALRNQNTMISFTEKYNKDRFHETIFNILSKKTVVYHIHTDIKFIQGVYLFNNEKIDNKIILLGKKNKYNGPFKNKIQHFQHSRKDFHKIINLCKSSDIVVLYGLNFQKSYISNRLPKSVTVIWRFFGSELYNLIPQYVFSEKTRDQLIKNRKSNLGLLAKKWIKFNSIQLRYRSIVNKELKDAAFQRADLFLGLLKAEYDFLKEKWPDLPPFLQIGIPNNAVAHTFSPKVKSQIIIGNNRSAYNNHIDILDLISASKNKHTYEFLMFFNYGFNNNYTENIRSEAAKIKEIKVIENFLPREEFNNIYNDADALVINGHRQMAIGNIWEAIQKNTKLYLNKKNLVYKALTEEGFLVYTMEDFSQDLDSNNTILTETEADRNQKMLKLFSEKYNLKKFHESILNIDKN